MNNINPVDTISWKKLEKYTLEIKNKISIKDLFKNDLDRFNNFSKIFEENILVDFSKNLINKNILNLLIDLAKECNLKYLIDQLFNGNILNKTEKNYVLYPLLRSNNINNYKNEIYIENIEILNKIEKFCNKFESNEWLGYKNDIITDIVNIGIGGSDLGPQMIIESLKFYKRNNLSIHFVSNIHGINLSYILKKLNPAKTLFIISSKSFTTQETIINANNAKNWFLKESKFKKYLNKHFIIISSNLNACKLFEISNDNFFKMFNWVNGRFSIWSSIGLIISLTIGFKNFKKLLNGANSMDNHFKNTKLNNNIPVILSLISIFYNNFLNFDVECIIPYHYGMSKFYSYYQQLSMESNGKIIDRNNNIINKYKTCQISFGGVGTNSQHSFFQLLHQGTKTIPCDLIIISKSDNDDIFKENNDMLISHCLSQSMSLSFGNIDTINEENKYELCFGNKPNNIILLKELNPYILGSLISMYEHKIFVQGIILNIYSFDQWGVELGKKIYKNIFNDIKNNTINEKYDSSTKNIIKKYKSWK